VRKYLRQSYIFGIIQINKDRDDGVTTIVEIRGSKEGQQKAKQLIEELG